MIPAELKKTLEHQQYRIVGRHSAVKICHWTKKSIKDEGYCYKQRFYGIQSHRCLQMTPAVAWCTSQCVYCWRATDYLLSRELDDVDEPSTIIDNAIKQQRTLLTGFGGIPDRINPKKYEEAQNPNQVAISLGGEPVIYPLLSELIEEFHQRNFTTFLVTNGTLPEKLESLDTLPTQLYVSLDAPTEEIYKKLDRPMLKNAWQNVKKTMELFPSLNTKKVVRLTMVRGWNMLEHGKYAKLIAMAEPDFVEVKAFMLVGGSRERLKIENMPTHDEIRTFADKLSQELSYNIKDEKEDSRVVLLEK